MKRFSPLKDVIVYDNVFDLQELNKLNNLIDGSLFSIKGWHDRVYSKESYIHSNWSVEDLHNSKLLTFKGIKDILEENSDKYSIENLSHIILNLDTLSDSHWPHTHKENVMLIYIAEEWGSGWGGETLFYDRDAKEIVYGSQYTPNRVILFDGGIPHNIKHQNRIAEKYRLTLSIFFNKGGTYE